MSITLSNIKHNLELLKTLVKGSGKSAKEAKTKIDQVYGSELDLSILDRLLVEGKGKLKELGLDYNKLGRVDIWRIVPFGNHILNLARLPDLPLSDNISQYF